MSQSVAESGDVPNASLRKGRCTTATCSASETAMAPQSQVFAKSPENALRLKAMEAA